MKLTFPSRLILVVLAALLTIPVAGIGLQDPNVLIGFHNRTLTAWPRTDAFLDDPALYFVQARKWLGDRVYPIVEATKLYKKIKLTVLNTPPERRITMGPDDIIFLNAASDANINGMLEMICVYSRKPGTIEAFKKALGLIYNYSVAHELPIDVVVFPTKETLYGNKLPASVPKRLRTACSENSPLDGIDISTHPIVVFPISTMREKSSDPAFFPKGNWHPRGLSIQTMRNAYLQRRGVQQSVAETRVLVSGQSELMGSYGIDWHLPEYKIVNNDLIIETDVARQFSESISDLFEVPRRTVQAFSNPKAIIQESILMVSDSYGDPSAPIFAGAFKNFLHVTTNEMKNKEIGELFRRASLFAKIDRVIMLVQEGNTDRVVVWGDSLTLQPQQTP
jgi:hypothetical protein